MNDLQYSSRGLRIALAALGAAGIGGSGYAIGRHGRRKKRPPIPDWAWKVVRSVNRGNYKLDPQEAYLHTATTPERAREALVRERMTAIDRRIQDAKSQGRTAMARLWDGLKEIIAEATTKTAKREGARLVSHMIEETLRGGGYTMRPDDMREIERMTSNVNRDRAVSTSELGKSMHPVNFELVPSAELEEIERYIAGASLIGKGLTWGRRLLKGTRGLFASKAGPAAAKTGARAGVKGWMRPKPGRLSRAWNFGLSLSMEGALGWRHALPSVPSGSYLIRNAGRIQGPVR